MFWERQIDFWLVDYESLSAPDDICRTTPQLSRSLASGPSIEVLLRLLCLLLESRSSLQIGIIGSDSRGPYSMKSFSKEYVFEFDGKFEGPY